MPNKIFPSTNDINDGRTLYEQALADWIYAVVGRNFVVSGLVVPAPPVSGLSVTFPTGVAMIQGRRVEVDSTNVVTVASGTATHYVYLQLNLDGFNNATGYSFVTNTTGVAPANSVLLATLGVTASNITSTTNRAPKGIGQVKALQPQSVVETSVNLSSTGETTLIDVSEEGELFEIVFSRSSGTGFESGTAALKFEIDNQTAVSWDAIASTVPDFWLWDKVDYAATDDRYVGRKLLIRIPYLTRLKISCNVTGTSSSVYRFRVLRGKAV